MKHLGDITKIKGCNAPVVDCFIGGSPCQDLSVAGKRAGLAGERSGLYMEQIRIIKEMRHKDELRGRTGESIRPRYMVWENVPGAFSSNQGKDFAAVLEEAIKVAEPEAPDVPVPEKGWPTSGCIMGDKWSVAWRVLDAQFWGVPQRRRRIALVADFGGQSAPEILFVRKSVSGNLEPGEQKRKEAPGDAGAGSGGAGKAVGFPLGFRPENVRLYDELATTLCNGTRPGFTTGVVQEQPLCIEMTSTKNTIVEDGVCPTLTARMGTGGNQVNAVLSAVGFDAYNQAQTGDVAKPLTAAATDSDHIPCVFHGAFQNTGIAVVEPVIDGHILDDQGGQQITVRTDGKCPTLRAEAHGNVPCVMDTLGFDDYNFAPTGDQACTLRAGASGGACGVTVCCTAYGIGNGQVNQPLMWEKVGALNCMHDQQAVCVPAVAHTLRAKASCAFREDSETYIVAGVACRDATENPEMNATPQSGAAHNINSNNVVRVRYIVRRLTPLECERLQGYPDGWTDIGEWVDSKGKKHKEADSPRYKALGNSIAIPPWKWVLKRLCACYERDATMASLFDGIGGFPYIWEQLNGKGSCLWASEIEEFPMAVTKIRFGGSMNENQT